MKNDIFNSYIVDKDPVIIRYNALYILGLYYLYSQLLTFTYNPPSSTGVPPITHFLFINQLPSSTGVPHYPQAVNLGSRYDYCKRWYCSSRIVVFFKK